MLTDPLNRTRPLPIRGNVYSRARFPPCTWTSRSQGVRAKLLGVPWSLVVAKASPMVSPGSRRRPWPVQTSSVMNGERAVTRGTRGEELETRGHFCKASVTCLNSERPCSQLVTTSGLDLQNRQGTGRAGALSLWTWAACAGFGPVLFKCFSFSFITRAKTNIEKGRKMLKL